MVYLVHSSGTKFWRCVKTDPTTVAVTYGKVGAVGRAVPAKKFDAEEDADAHRDKQVASKLRGGYGEATDPTNDDHDDDDDRFDPPSPLPDDKKKRGRKNATPCTPPSVRGGLAGLRGEEDGLMDSGVAGLDPALASRARVVDGAAARLAAVDPSKNTDKYYVLQLLIAASASKQKKARRGRAASEKAAPEHFLFTRWGRTGTGGQAKLEGPFTELDDAEAAFNKVFKAKVGVNWKNAVPGAPPKKDKYEYLPNKKRSDGGDVWNWFYYLKNDPLGKVDGWHAFDEENSDEVEQLYGDFVATGRALRLSSRLIFSESSGFTYTIDLCNMNQTNNSSGTRRPIGRTRNGETLAEMTAKPPTPKKVVAAKSPATKTNTTAAKTCAVSTCRVDGAASSALQGGSVYEGYDAMLNQTNIGQNNNKFYKLQLVEVPGSGVYLFTKWGRVGECGTTQDMGPLDNSDATKEFEKKFKSKTGNKWEDRGNFLPKKGKYALVEMETDEQAASAINLAAVNSSGVKGKVMACTLDSITESFVDLIFDEDMFKSAMSNMNLDPGKLPLGALSKQQIRKGFTVLENLQEELDGASNDDVLTELTSEFYTTIPHAFGRSRGPVLNTKKMVSDKFEMLNTLTDIEEAQAMQRQVQQQEDENARDHPSDLNYQQLCSNLSHVGKTKKDYKLIEKYFKDTKTGHTQMKLRNIWTVDRHEESARFSEHDDLQNRKLLWHGTNVAVVAAILKGGLRIMPHSGGRVGSGIYLADQHQKSAWYVRPAKGTAVMFLVEAALGKEHVITADDSTLTSPPAGFDSVLALGRMAPPKNKSIVIDGKSVQVPHGKPTEVVMAKNSSFHENEFLVYQESQHRIRYVIAFDS